MSPQAQKAVTLKVATLSAVLLALALPAQASDSASGSTATMPDAKVSKRPQRALLLSVGQSNQSTDAPLSQSLQGLGYTDVIISDDSSVSDWALGYRQPLGNRFSIDIQYQHQGSTTPDVQATPTLGTTNAQAAEDTAKAMPKRGKGVSAIALYHYPVGSKLSLQAGLGAYAWKSKRTATVGSNTFISKSDGVSAVAQLGVSYPITNRVRLEGHWQYFDMPDEPVDRLGIGISIGF